MSLISSLGRYDEHLEGKRTNILLVTEHLHLWRRRQWSIPGLKKMMDGSSCSVRDFGISLTYWPQVSSCSSVVLQVTQQDYASVFLDSAHIYTYRLHCTMQCMSASPCLCVCVSRDFTSCIQE